ncbi:hypothetical protein J31TS4_31350 [Paenibacillus sp. J31TS4]|uniref:extracellular solute-binding protein n=1 Tax=Paenibacillus sp. J31TS4 TaxID=2807195 RepID=UPI001B24D3F0|nr:extracellular solute-binding protein [Paenibacillus sp. J31TS4]GIP39855.1 hypothetical protein J31TS4_31350 [Paenibacillus sp. J31TS4]
MGKPDRRTFHTRLKRMVSDLRNRITAGEYAQGDFLPSELALKEQYELSKNSVRIGLDQLTAEGLIVKIPRVGTQVAVQAEPRTVIRFGVYPSMFEEAEMEELIARFQEKHPGIRVETLVLPYTRADDIEKILALGIVDAFTVNLFNLYQLEDRGSLRLFEKQETKEETHPFLRRQFACDAAESVAQPFAYSPVILCYNKEHFQERRLFEPDSSWTWNDLFDAVRKLKAPGRFGLAFNLYSFNRWPLFLLHHETHFLRGEDGAVNSLSPDGLGLLRRVRDTLREEGVFPLALASVEGEAEKLFVEQKASVILTTYYSLNRLREAKFAFDVAQLPGEVNNDSLLLATGIAVNALSKCKETASRLADFLTSEEAQSLVRRRTYTLPANKYVSETIEPELPRKPSRLELHRELIPKYATYRKLGISMNELMAMEDCVKQYIASLVDEQGFVELLNAKLK